MLPEYGTDARRMPRPARRQPWEPDVLSCTRMENPVRLLDLGRRRYAPVLELQRALHAAVAQGREPDTWLVVEHDPVITLGRNAKQAHVLLPPPPVRGGGT